MPGSRAWPSRQVGGVAHGRVVHDQVVADRADHHRSGVQPDAELLVEPVALADGGGVLDERLLHLEGSQHGPPRGVLVRQRRPEQGHDPVASELGDGALVAVNGLHHPRHRALHHRVDLLRVHALAVRRRPDRVREQHRHHPTLALDRPALLQDPPRQVSGGVGGEPARRCRDRDGRRRGRALGRRDDAGKRVPAVVAEARPLAVLLAAVLADQHRQTFRFEASPCQGGRGRGASGRHGDVCQRQAEAKIRAWYPKPAMDIPRGRCAS